MKAARLGPALAELSELNREIEQVLEHVGEQLCRALTKVETRDVRMRCAEALSRPSTTALTLFSAVVDVWVGFGTACSGGCGWGFWGYVTRSWGRGCWSGVAWSVMWITGGRGVGVRAPGAARRIGAVHGGCARIG
ncbi:hypothetical protein GCM10010378_30670 [Streptomyces viridochromogenes]